MSESLFDCSRPIDTDTHVTEPADVWTSRVSSKWGDAIPHVERIDGVDTWIIGGQSVGAPGAYTMAGFDGTLPECRPTYEDCPPASFDATARLAHMDENGIWAQILYPNAGGFGGQALFRLKNPELMLECVRAYNDFLVEWCSVDPNRLVPILATPFWDVDATVAEIQRCAKLGHKAVLVCNRPEDWGQPPLFDRHWDPIWATAQDCDLPISFHIGGGDLGDMMGNPSGSGVKANFARMSSTLFIDNSKTIADVIFGGVAHRFPKLAFVSVESGAGWLPTVLESMDWQWRNGGVRGEHPEYDLLPSEYFERQVYGCFWFEESTIREAIARYPANIMWETDYPHPTCMAPGPQTPAVRPREYVDRALAGLPDKIAKGVLHDTAARLYKLD